MTARATLSTPVAVVILAGVTLLTHGAALRDGLAFDDYLHQANFRKLGWSPQDLIDSTTFQFPVRDMYCWWQPRSFEWRYARPVAFCFMKIEFVLFNGDAFAIHACMLGWHLLAGALVYQIARWALDAAWPALLAGTLFIINPHAVSTVGWVAAHNALIGGVFVFAATWAYIRAAFDGRSPRAGLRPGWLFFAIALWVAGLYSRESAIAWPLLAGLLELTFVGWRHALRRWPLLVVLAAIAGLFVLWRIFIFDSGAVPQIYFTTPRGLAIVGWIAGKLLQLLFALFIYTPLLIGLVTQSGLSMQHLAAYGFMTAVMALLGWWYIRASRGLPGRWMWPAWCVAGFLPVVPVFIMPHFAYLPAAGHAIALAVMLTRLRGWLRPVVTVVVVGLTLWSLVLYRWCWRGIVRSEQLVHADVLDHTERPPPNSELFFINLPVAGFYTSVALQETWGDRTLRSHALTFAPHPLMMREPFTLRQISDHELSLSTPEPGYFSGFSGQMLVGGMWPGEEITEGRTFAGELFDTTVVRRKAGGVTELLFHFHKPLATPGYYFYVSTPERGAWRLRFDRPFSDAPDAGETAAWRKRYAAWIAEREWFFVVLETAQRILRADALLTN